MRYVFEGHLLPKDALITVRGHQLVYQLDGETVKSEFEVDDGKVRVTAVTTNEVHIANLRNAVSSDIAALLNLVGFFRATAISSVLDSMSIDNGEPTPLPTESFIFAEESELSSLISFRPTNDTIQFKSFFLQLSFLSIATHNLRCAIVYPDYTLAHCRMAIEALKNCFEEQKGTNGWNLLQDALHLRDTTLRNEDAHEFRHGRMMPQTWEQRRRAMQIAWEVCHRFMQWALRGQKPLRDPEFPLL